MEPSLHPPLRVIGVGASAGGLEAMREMFGASAPRGALAFLVVQHLSDQFQTALPELLGRETDLEVRLAESGMEVRPDTIYICPPHRNMRYVDGTLHLERWAEQEILQLPIDHLFHSLEEGLGERAVGVVLSGSGRDGAAGLAAIHAAGGLTVVQDPESAEFSAMPEAALRSTACDLVLPPEGIRAAIVDHLELTAGSPAPARSTVRDALARIRGLLHETHGLQLSLYKEPMIRRRVERRAVMLRFDRLEDYASHLEEDAEELQALYDDMLIGVTRFFRDEAAFASLEDALSRYLDDKRERPLRVWVPACASGEEAYSVAMILADLTGDPSTFKIFATDLSRAAVRLAGAGVFGSEDLEGVSPARRERYFELAADGRWRVGRALRDRIAFATHDLLVDPPISRLDLVTCRNALIYLNTEGQNRTLERLFFGLKHDGLLFLGPSESAGPLAGRLQELDGRWRLYRKSQTGSARARPLGIQGPRVVQPLYTERFQPHSAERLAYDALLATYAPPGLLVDGELRVAHVFGDGVKYLETRSGRPSNLLRDMLREDLVAPVLGVLHRAMESGDTGVETCLPEALGGTAVQVRPLAGTAPSRHYLVTFGEPPTVPSPAMTMAPDRAVSERAVALERELEWTRHSLQVALEVGETSNEELQATNEELVAANEELQSANEELRSVNEELHAVNVGFRRKNDELSALTADLENLIQSTEMAVVFLDRQLRVRRSTPAADTLLHLRLADRERPFAELASTDLHRLALDLAGQVLGGRTVVDRQAEHADGRCFLLRCGPYLSGGGTPAGVVLTLIDITELQTVTRSLAMQERVLELMEQGVVIWQLEQPGRPETFRMLYANSAADRIVGRSFGDLIGRYAGEISPAGRAAGVFDAMLDVVGGSEAHQQAFVIETGGAARTFRVTMSPWASDRVVVVYEDATAEVQEQMAQEAERRLQTIGEISGRVAHDLNNLLGVILATTEMLPATVADESALIERAAEQAADLVARLLAYSKRRPIDPVVVDLEVLVREQLPMLRRLLGLGTELELEVLGPVGRVRLDRGALEQVLVNLIGNAGRAIGEGTGRVTLRLCPYQDAGQDWIRLEVEDDGCGMSPEVLARCFEPFFTTQVGGQGTGLGLASAQGVIRQAGGQLTAASEEGRGSTFTLLLPCTEAPVQRPHLPPAPASTPACDILVVDDESTLASACARMLRELGHRVRVAEGGEAAMRIVEAFGAPDLLVTDVLMPSMNGPKLAERIRRVFPELPVLYMSGYADHPEVRGTTGRPGADHFLEKPFASATLDRAVRLALSGAGAGPGKVRAPDPAREGTRRGT